MRDIKMTSISAGPEGVFLVGQKRTLPEHEAAAFVHGGHAEYTTIEPPERAVVIPEEVAVIIPEEKAVIEQPEAPKEIKQMKAPVKTAWQKGKVKK